MRWQDMTGMVGYGYEGTVIFLAEVQVPASTTPGQAVELGVQVDYMVCKEICLNETGGDKVELTVVAGSAEGVTEEEGSTDAGEAVRRSEAAKQLKQAQIRVPQPVGEDTATVKAGEGGEIVIEAQLLKGATNVQAFPAPPQGVVVEQVTVETAGERATVTLRVRRLGGMEVKEKQFEVVVGYDLNEDRRGVSVMVPLPGGEGSGSD
jgi:DsbC/DsbD-like thiol-disulfide interchange protein